MNEEFKKRIRNSKYFTKVMSAKDAAAFVKKGMTLAVSGFSVGYPKVIASELAKRAESGENLELTVYSGASLGDEFDGELSRKGALKKRMPYQTNHDLRKAINEGKVEYNDISLGQMPVWIKRNFLNSVDIAIIEAAAIDENGNIIPTTSVGTSNIYAQYANKIIIELNTYVPSSIEGVHDIYSPKNPPNTEPIPLTKANERIGTPYIKCDFDKVIAVVQSDFPDNGPSVVPTDSEFRQMARHLIDFLHKEIDAKRLCNPLPPIQAGVGSVSNAVLEGLMESDFKDLIFYSEVLQNSVFDLIEAGKVKFASGTSLTISWNKRDEFFKNFDKYKEKIILRPQEISNHPEIIRRLGVIAINTIIEADIYGNTNSAYINGNRLMNGIGGSADFCENAGLSVFITKSTAKDGAISSIVPFVSHVDHTVHGMHVLITEQGVADLRGLDHIKRAKTIIGNCAHPKFRQKLYNYLEKTIETCPYKQKPFDFERAHSFYEQQF